MPIRLRNDLRQREVTEFTILRVISEMRKQVNCTVGLEDWACYAGMNKFRFISSFKTLTGLPPKTFHNAEKLEIAKRLLVFDRLSVTEVCFEIGFESVGSFVTKFSQSVGIPPGIYAREMQATGLFRLLRLAFFQYRNQTRQSARHVQSIPVSVIP
ncbi:MAG: AraC family transcriptional regulator, partial [Rhodobacteraceae bacterium]|nr:AraC family transcriptional regulator [Paracoccaceae bacterium]